MEWSGGTGIPAEKPDARPVQRNGTSRAAGLSEIRSSQERGNVQERRRQDNLYAPAAMAQLLGVGRS